MALVDSEAAFEAHCDKIDGSGALKRLFSAKGLKTMSQLAFVCGTPQSPPSETEFATFCTELNNGIALSMSQFAEVRRLHFESSTMVVAHLKTQVSMDGCPDAVRKLPVAEKQARLIAKQARLRGVKITGELQPSYMLIDLVASMVESKSVIWICPSRCSKQEMEIHHTMKEKPSTVSVEQHLLRVTTPDHVLRVDISTELPWQWAMMRRGISFDQAGLIEWETHQSWTQQLLGLVSKDAPDGYSRVRLDQLVKADREMFTLMSEELQTSGKRLTDTPAPMNDAMVRLSTDPRVTMFLFPLPRSSKSAASDVSSYVKPTGDAEVVKRPKPKIKKPSAKAKNLCPEELGQHHETDSDNNRICWAFNMKNGCSLEVKDGKCRKGVHKCCKCLRGNHSLVACRAKA